MNERLELYACLVVDIDINACVLDESHAPACAVGGEAVPVSYQHDNGRGYPPMSNDDGLAGAGKINPTLPNFSIPPLDTCLPAVIPTIISATPIIPLPADEDFYAWLPENFSPARDANILIPARKNFSLKILDDLTASKVADRLVAYFSRPLDGVYDEVIHHRDGTEEVIKKPYRASLPLVTEFANMIGMTERELNMAGKDFPNTLGRAVEFAHDVIKTRLTRGGLEGVYNPQFTVFVATNETTMKAKTEHVEKVVNMNDLLDRIEKAQQPVSYQD